MLTTQDRWLRRLNNPVLGRIWVPQAFTFSLWDLTWNLDKFSPTANQLPTSYFEHALSARPNVIYLPHVSANSISSYAKSVSRPGFEWTLGARDAELVLDRSPQYPYFGSPTAHRKRRFAALERQAGAGFDADLFEVVDEHRIPDLIDAIHNLEAKSWKRYSKYGATARFKRRDFLRVASTAAELGVLRSSTLSLDGEPVALHLGMVSGGEYSFWYSVFSEEHRNRSPGILLLLRVFGALPQDVGTFSFLRGDEAYKQAFGPRSVELIDIAFAKRGQGPRTHSRLAHARAARPRVASLVKTTGLGF